MQLSKNLFSFALIASTLSVGSVFAEQSANFHLPVPAKFGNTLLEPGDYRMELPSASTGVQSVCMKNGKKSVVALPYAARPTETKSNKSYLQLVNVNGTYFVRKYTSGVTGKTLLFGIPKVHNDWVPQSATDIEGGN